MSLFPAAPILVFDIETIADVAGAQRIYPNLASLDAKDARQALTSLREQEAGHDFMRLPLQRIVCISALYINQGQFSLFSLSAETLDEETILRKFFRAFKSLDSLPQLVSWNGSGFDIPVMIYRAMQYNLSVPLLFEEGNRINNMRFDNYVNRFQTRHLDLMDRFSQYGASRRESMDVVASLYGLPGKTDIDGSMVGDLVEQNDWHTLTQYCESDVLNTWLIYLRWVRLTGQISGNDFTHWQTQTHAYLSNLKGADDKLRHQTFLQDWQITPPLTTNAGGIHQLDTSSLTISTTDNQSVESVGATVNVDNSDSDKPIVKDIDVDSHVVDDSSTISSNKIVDDNNDIDSHEAIDSKNGIDNNTPTASPPKPE